VNYNTRPNPYVGPRAFLTGETFYGRDHELRSLSALLIAERIVLLHSPSGAGKTSLIQAGLLPRLSKQDFNILPIIRVNQEPPEGVASTPNSNRYALSAMLSLEEGIPDDQRMAVKDLADLTLEEYLHRRPKAENNPVSDLLIFDQFEEVLTIASSDQDSKTAFFEQLGKALRNKDRWALFAIREDYLGALAHFTRPIPGRFAASFRLNLLGVEGAMQAIQKPAGSQKVDFVTSAAQKLVDDLRRIQVQLPDGSLKEQPGPYIEPVQLQVVCFRLWNNLSAVETTISENHLASIGSVNESLSAYYTDQVGAAKEKFNVLERIIREWFNNQLITKQGIRSQVLLEPEKSAGLDNQVIRFLESVHLVRGEKRGGFTWFELSHDRLIEPIQADNQKWLITHLTLLQQQAALWNQQNRPDSLLLRGNELAQAISWAKVHGTELLPYETDFLSACKEEEKRTLRLKRRNQVISALGIVAIILAIIAFLAYRQADIARQDALRQERAARADQLASQSQTALIDYPQRSLLLALEALKVNLDAGETRQVSAEEALRAALDQSHGLPIGNHSKPVTVVAYSNDEHWLATGSEDMTIELWDLHASGPSARPIILNSNGTEIRVMGFSSDGHWLAAGGDNKNALLWNISDISAPPFILSGHLANIESLAFSPDVHWLATGSADDNIHLWNLQNPNPEQNSIVLTGHHGDITTLAFDPTGQWLASGSLDATARLWKMTDLGTTSIVLAGHLRNISALAFSPDDHWLATGSYDDTARLWDLKATDPAANPIVLAGHSGKLTSCAFSPDDQWLATGSEDDTARLWNLKSGDPASNPIILRGHGDAITTLAFSPSTSTNPGGRWLATGSSDHSVRLWDLHASDPAANPVILRGHDDAIVTMAFSPDGQWLVTGSADSFTRLWNMGTSVPAENPEILRGPNDEVSQIAFSQDGRWLAAGSLDGSAFLWDLNTANPPANPLSLRQSNLPIFAVTFSLSGHWLATAGGGGTIWLWNLNTANPQANPAELLGNTNPVTTLAFSTGASSDTLDRWLASGSQDGSVRLWDLQTNDLNAAPRLMSTDPNHPVVGLTFSPDSHWLAAASGFTVWVWDMSNPKAAPIALKKHEDRVTTLAFSPDGHWLATGSMDKTAQLWVLSSSMPSTNPLILSGHEDSVSVLAFSFDSHWLATGSQDHTVRLWDLHAANPAINPIVLRGHNDNIHSLAFSSDGNWLATGSDDHTTRLWDLRAANPASDSVVLIGQDGTINSIAFSQKRSAETGANIQWLATGSSDHTVRLWFVQLGELESQACQSAGRNLTSKEWAQYFPNQAYEKTCNQFPATP
jgi:WD40 repeat protein